MMLLVILYLLLGILIAIMGAEREDSIRHVLAIIFLYPLLGVLAVFTLLFGGRKW